MGLSCIALFKISPDFKRESWERPMATFLIGVEHNDMANSAMTHLPQVKSTCSDIIELGLHLLLNRILHITPNIAVSNFYWKCMFGRGADYPTEQRPHDSSRQGFSCHFYTDRSLLPLTSATFPAAIGDLINVDAASVKQKMSRCK